MKGATMVSEKVSKFVLDDFNSFQNLILVSSTGNDHLTAAENQTDNLGIVESINETRELLRLVLDLVDGQVEGEVVEVQLAGCVGVGLAGELVLAVVVHRVMEGVGGHHVLDLNLDVFNFPRGDARGAEIGNHALDAGLNVLFVLSTGAHGTTGAEHENGELRVNDTVHDTGELFGLVFTVELDGDVRQVEFFGNAGARNNVHHSQALFIGGHGRGDRPPVFKERADVDSTSRAGFGVGQGP